jgi:regulatory protein
MSEDRRKRREPRRATAKYLRNAALHYLERYATSSAHLRRRLMVKVARSAAAHGTDAAAGAADVETLIGRLEQMGLLDDEIFARAKARALHRRGNSARAVRAALREKGVAADLIEAALESLKENTGHPELAAALVYARKRRLGPYRAPEARAEIREKDMAALGRRGFSYDLARRIVDAADPAELEAEARGMWD